MSFPTITIALCLSAIAALAFTGAAMSPKAVKPRAVECGEAQSRTDGGAPRLRCHMRFAEGSRIVPDERRERRHHRRPPVDCHRDARRHRLAGYDRPVLHMHVGPDCRVRVIHRSTVPN